MNSKCGHFSRRDASASINRWRYLYGTDVATAGISAGLTAKIHFLMTESSFKRRLRINALLGWFSSRALSTACWAMQAHVTNDIKIGDTVVKQDHHI
jgi:hypothetical protein